METKTSALDLASREIVFVCARSAAIQGNYQESEDLLRSLIAHYPEPKYLDLLARVYAQQKRFTEAVAEWKKALALAPEFQDAEQSIRKASACLTNRNRFITPPGNWLSLVLSLCFLLSIAGNFFSIPKYLALTAQQEKVIGQRSELERTVNDLEHDLSSSKQGLQEAIQGRDEQESEIKTLKRQLANFESGDRERFETLKKDLNFFREAFNKKLVSSISIGNAVQHVKGLRGFEIEIHRFDHKIHVSGKVPTDIVKSTVEKIIQDIDPGYVIHSENLKITHQYVIQKSDTLSGIAGNLYGDAQKWNLIYSKNKNLISNPDLIRPNVTILTPKE